MLVGLRLSTLLVVHQFQPLTIAEQIDSPRKFISSHGPPSPHHFFWFGPPPLWALPLRASQIWAPTLRPPLLSSPPCAHNAPNTTQHTRKKENCPTQTWPKEKFQVEHAWGIRGSRESETQKCFILGKRKTRGGRKGREKKSDKKSAEKEKEQTRKGGNTAAKGDGRTQQQKGEGRSQQRTGEGRT